MSADHDLSWLRRIWTGWRREIVRGVILFFIVVAGGLFVLRQVRAFEPLTMLREMNFEDHGHGDRNWTDAFHWAGRIEGDQPLWVRNMNGEIIVERADGDSVIVIAQKSWRRGDPESVEIMAVPSSEGSVTICALWKARESECGPDGEYHQRGTKGHSDVAVRFVIRLPRGVELDASTVNGAITAAGVASPLELETVNGAVTVNAVLGPLKATTVNGSITAALEGLAGEDAMELETVNGSIHAQLPPDANADVEATTVNGKVHSDLPLRIVGRFNPRRLEATLGDGGTKLSFQTVNGSVTLGPLTGHPPEPSAAPAAPARARVTKPPCSSPSTSTADCTPTGRAPQP